MRSHCSRIHILGLASLFAAPSFLILALTGALSFFFASSKVFAQEAPSVSNPVSRTQTDVDAELMKNPEKKKLDPRIQLQLGGEHYEDQFNKGLLSSAAIDLDLQREWTYARVFAEVRLKAEQGQVQGLESQPNRRSSGFYLLNAGGSLQTFLSKYTEAEASLGALKPEDQLSPLLVSGQTFPSSRQSVKYEFGKWKIKAVLTQAVPTSTTLSTRAVDKEPTPYFFTESLHSKLLLSDFFEVNASITHFNFVNLPDRVAFDSRLYGNSVNVLDTSRGRYAYGFEGLQPTLGASLKFQKWEFYGETQYLINHKAPSGQNEGVQNTLGFLYAWNPHFLSWLSYGVYENQADSSSAYYNSWTMGHNNVKGEILSAGFNIKDPNLKLKANYIRTQVLVPNVYQSDADFIGLNLETTYE